MNLGSTARTALLITPFLSTAVRADETARVSLTSTDGQGSGASGTGPVHAVAISGDGTKVVFAAAATNLVPDDTNGVRDIFVRDVAAGTTVRASVSSAEVQGNDDCTLPRISAQGRYVVFHTFATNLVANDTNGWNDVFVRDLVAGTTARESVSSGETQGNLNSESGSLSADGRYLGFWSNASNLVPSNSNATGDIFLRDRQLGTTDRVNITWTGVQSNDNSMHPFLSSDASELAYASEATNIVPSDTNAARDVFIVDLVSFNVARVGTGGAHPQPNGDSERPSLSTDGRYVAFQSVATDLVPNDTNGWQDAFVHDRVTGETTRVSVTTSGAQASSMSFYAVPSADASAIAFGSHATNLVTGDSNGSPDVFLRTLSQEPMAYCFGATQCPCFNGSGAQAGCENSSGVGAELDWSGTTSAGDDDLVLEGHDLLPGQPALGFSGLNWIANGAGTPFGDGLRCAGDGIRRLGVTIPNVQGDADLGPGLGAIGGWFAGETRYFQLWYRDPVGGPCGTGFNLTNGLMVVFGL